MAPDISTLPIREQTIEQQKSFPTPLKLSGALEKFAFEETTPAIGREFLGVNIVDDLLNAANSDELLRDLAITSKKQPFIVILFIG